MIAVTCRCCRCVEFIKLSIQLKGIVDVWRWNGQRRFYDPKACLLKVISSRGLKTRFSVAKMHQNVIEDYVQPVARMRYSIGRFHDGLKCFMWKGIRLWFSNAQVGRPFLEIALTSWVVRWVLSFGSTWTHWHGTSYYPPRQIDKDVFLPRIVAIDETWARG